MTKHSPEFVVCRNNIVIDKTCFVFDAYHYASYHSVFRSIVVFGALKHCALPHFVCDLKTTQINVQRSLIRELTLSELELGHKAAQAAKKKHLLCAR